jgi:hypothetical protein
VHAKYCVTEPVRKLSSLEVKQRVCAALDCSPEDHFSHPKMLPDFS